MRINFQPPDAQIPNGYLMDHGLQFQPVDGFDYGWNCQLAAIDFRDRSDSHLSDRDNTVVIIDRYGLCEEPVRWDIAATRGAYEVTIGYKDPHLADKQVRASHLL